MDIGLAVAISLALAFAVTNGLLDASNAIATLVATRAARPGQAIVLATIFNLVGPFVVGAAVADTIGGIVTVSPSVTTEVIGCGLAAAVTWNLTAYWLGLPSSSGHALVGGLVGAALVEGGVNAINWGGIESGRPVGVFGVLIALAVAPVVGGLAALVAIRTFRRLARRVTRAWDGSVTAGQWAMSSALAFSHGANDAQKAIGVIAALLLGAGKTHSTTAPTWATLACAVALVAGTALGGWRIIRTVGRRIYRLQAIEGLASETSSAGVILGASLIGAPTSTSQVVASSVVGIGGGRRRLRHVNWALVRNIGLAWLVTIPATCAMAAVALTAWRWVT
jgi:inorganic phosphate transporter, PiT family